MTPKQSLKLFEGTTIRTIWDSEKEEWFFSVADVCNALSGSQAKDPNAYWRKLKQRLKAEGSEVVTNCHGLKLEAADGKKIPYGCIIHTRYSAPNTINSKSQGRTAEDVVGSSR